MDASRITCVRSASTVSSSPFVFPEASRCSASSWRTVPMRQGTHWPHDSSRKNSAMRSTASTRSACSPKTMTTPEPSVAPASRAPSKESARSSWSGRRNEPAAPPSRTAFGGSLPASSSSSAQRRAELELVQARPRDVTGDAEEPRVARVVLEHDVRHVEQRLDVVHDRRLPEQPDLDRERRLVARLAAVALDRLEERRLLAADVRARADAQLDLDADVGAVDRVLQPLVRERVLRAHVDEGAARSRSRRRRCRSTRRARTDPAPSARGP